MLIITIIYINFIIVIIIIIIVIVIVIIIIIIITLVHNHVCSTLILGSKFWTRCCVFCDVRHF